MEDLKESVVSPDLGTIAPEASSINEAMSTAAPETPKESLSIESSTPVEATSTDQALSEEKMVPQSKVNSVVGPLNKKVKETEQRLAQLQKQHEELSNRLKGIQDPSSPDAIKTLARSEMVSAQYEQEVSQLYSESKNHINESEAKFRQSHPDYDEAINTVIEDFARLNQINPQLTFMLSQTKDPASVVYKLSKDPEKFGQFATLVGNGYKQSAQAFLHKLESELQAPVVKQPTITAAPPKPLSPVVPSPKAVGEGKDYVANGNVRIDHSKYRY